MTPREQYQKHVKDGHSASAEGAHHDAVRCFTMALKLAEVMRLPSVEVAGVRGRLEYARGRLQGATPRNQLSAKAHFEAGAKHFREANDTAGALTCEAFEALTRYRLLGDAVDAKARAMAASEALERFAKAAEHASAGKPFFDSLRQGLQISEHLFQSLAHTEAGEFKQAERELDAARTGISSAISGASADASEWRANEFIIPTVSAIILLAKERSAWRSLDLPRARYHVSEAIAAGSKVRRMGGPTVGDRDESADDMASLPSPRIGRMALRTIDAFELMLAGRVSEATRAIGDAVREEDRAIRLLARDQTRAGLLRSCHHDERSALLRTLRTMVEGRDHPLFHYLADREFNLTGPLGEQVKRDLSELERIWSVEAWRLTIIAAGALMEALVLHALLDKRGEASRADLEKKGLKELLDAACADGLLSQSSRFLSDALREHRNLIHPGKEARSKYVVDRSVAHAALEVLRTVLTDLRVTHARPPTDDSPSDDGTPA